MSEVRTRFKPSAVVCQCGVDTLASDPMASFNLTQQSIGECVKYLMNWNLPLLLLGGGKFCAINPNTKQQFVSFGQAALILLAFQGHSLLVAIGDLVIQGDLLRPLRSSELQTFHFSKQENQINLGFLETAHLPLP